MATIIPVAYNPSLNPIPGTEQVGELAIGITSQDYSLQPGGVRFWATPDLDLGYVIAHVNPSGNQPNPVSIFPTYVGFWRSDSLTESSFIELAEDVSVWDGNPQTFTNGLDAKTWLNNNGYWTSYSNVVTNGLTLQLDASNPASYSGSGNVWYDLVSPQENITLVNSPTFTSPSPSYFTFNGSNQYGVGTGPVLSPTEYTKSVWFYLNSYSDNNLVSSQDGGHFMYMASTNRIYCGHTDWPNYSVFPSNTTFALNTWYYVALTFNTTDGMKLYVNGVLDSTYTANKSPVVGNYSTNVGAFGTGNLLNGRIARVFCYNTSLSASEVLQNYNGTVPPFISVTPTPTSTNTPTPTVTPTPSVTPTNTITPTPTSSLTPTPTVTKTPTSSVTPTVTPTRTVTPTQTPSVTPTITPTPTRPANLYYRWQITETKTTPPDANAVQASEFVFQINGVDQSMAGVTVTNPGGSNPVGETPPNLVDNNLTTKVVDINFVTNGLSNFIFQFGSAKSFNGYRWATANDFDSRDPKSWTIAGSNNGTTWTTLSTVSNFTATVARDTYQTPQTY